MEYAKINDGKITEIVSTCENLPEGEWRILPTDFDCHINMDARFVDWSTGYLKPLERLAEEGLVEDRRGAYWHIDTRQPLEITEIGLDVPDGYTDKQPPDSNFAYWEPKNNQWQIDKAAEKDAQIQDIRSRRRYEFHAFDKYQTILSDTLTAGKKKQFMEWRQTWLDAPATGIEPERPAWFKE